MEEILKLKKTLKDKELLLKKKETSNAKKEVKPAVEEKPQITVPKDFGNGLS